MFDEVCFQVDENDQIVGKLTKFQAHQVCSLSNRSPLHRAFSVFLISQDYSKILIQKRSSKKITFPSQWANTCCSHPIDGLQENGPDPIYGVVRAACRKLDHELGIPEVLVRN